MTPPRAKARTTPSPGQDAAAVEDETGPDLDPVADAAAEVAQAEIDEGIAGLTYEEARDALLDVVRRLESGSETLEESLALWQRGESLARHCENWLAGARARIDAAQGRTDDE